MYTVINDYLLRSSLINAMARRTALLIGNDDYQNADLQRLIAPWDDVVSLKDALQDFGDFETMSPLYNANLASAQTAIATLFRDAAHDDLVLLYYTGHGVRDEDGNLFLALPDTDVDLLQANSISANFIREAMLRSHARAQVIILDCCHSGSFKMHGGIRRGSLESLRKDDLLNTDAGDVAVEGKYILTASEPNQNAWEKAGKSVFTRHLVDGLIDGSAAPEKDRITVQDLHAYVYRMINEDGAPQRPRLMMAASSPELVIARNPDPRRPIRQEILDAFWGADSYAALGATYLLIDLATGQDEKLAADAKAVLKQRLEQPDAVPLLVARPIQDWLDPEAAPEAPGFSEEQVELLRSEAEEARTQLKQQIGQLEKERSSQALQIERLEGELAQKELEAQEASEAEQVELIRSEAAEIEARLKVEIKENQTQRAAQIAEIAALKSALADANGTILSMRSDAAEARTLLQRQGEDTKQARQALEAEVARLRKTQWTGNDDPQEIFRDGRHTGWRQMGIAALIAFGALSFFGYAQYTRVVEGQSPEAPAPAEDLEVFSDCAQCPDMIRLSGGDFTMGSPDTEEGRANNEGPQRSVTIAPFALAATEVTFDQWQACVDGGGCQSNPSPSDRGWGRGSRPVIYVSWNDAQEYIAWLNARVEDADPYRLPTEAEWEFAARAGTTTPFSFGETISADQANFGSNQEKTVPVEQLDAANVWGLRHMHGNVWEWVEDCWQDTYQGTPNDGSAWLSEQDGNCSERVLRGGSWNDDPQYLRSANRSGYAPGFRYRNYGFRPARTLLTP